MELQIHQGKQHRIRTPMAAPDPPRAVSRKNYQIFRPAHLWEGSPKDHRWAEAMDKTPKVQTLNNPEAQIMQV